MRTVLIVAGEFPPLKTIGRIRTVKFVEHLRNHGWNAIVLTLAPNGREPNFDPTLESEVPANTEIRRVPFVGFEERIGRFAKRLLGRRDQAADAAGVSESVKPSAPRMGQTTRPGRVMDLAHSSVKALLRRCVDIPDDYLPWAFAAVDEGRRICRERKVDAIFTTLPPFSAAYVGYCLRRATGLPWLVDYRDLWYGDVLREWLPAWRQKLELAVERRLLRRADVIITVSEQKTAFMRRMHPRLSARWETLTNGYDIETYAGQVRTRPTQPGRIEFVYTGRLFKNRRGYAFAEALGRIKRTHPDLVGPVRVRFLGTIAPEIRARYDQLLSKFGIAGHFDFAGDVSYREAMDAQINCDYLLLIVDTGETSDGVIPGKLFEYVAARRPILALCGPGATMEIIEQARLGTVVPAEDVDRCEAALRDVLERPVPIATDRDERFLEQFDRKVIAERLGRLLDECVAAAPSHGSAFPDQAVPGEDLSR